MTTETTTSDPDRPPPTLDDVRTARALIPEAKRIAEARYRALLRRWIETEHLTQEQAADRLGVTRSTVSIDLMDDDRRKEYRGKKAGWQRTARTPKETDQ